MCVFSWCGCVKVGWEAPGRQRSAQRRGGTPLSELKYLGSKSVHPPTHIFYQRWSSWDRQEVEFPTLPVTGCGSLNSYRLF